MTVGTIFRDLMGPSAAAHHLDHRSKFLGERNGGGSDYYHHGSYKKHKGNSKSDKKHAILSALTLLAFLFFLSVLQNCIREQYPNRGPTMMFAPTGPTAPTGHQSKDQTFETASETPVRRKRTAPPEYGPGNGTKGGHRSRTLLGLEDHAPNRQTKFIRNFNAVNNWTRELSQLSEKDLEEQKLKTSNFPLYWKNNRFASTELTRATTVPGVVRRPFSMNETVPFATRRFKKREKTSGTTDPEEPAEGKTSPPGAAAQKPAWNYKNPPEKLQTPRFPQERPKSWFLNATQGATNGTRREATSAVVPQLTLTTPATRGASFQGYATTPRNRRSEYVSTARPADYDDYDRYGEHTREEPQLSPTPAVGLDLNTFQTFPVYNYHNHRHSADPYAENQTEKGGSPAEIDRVHHEPRPTTQQPLFHPTRISPSYARPPQPDKGKYRNRHPAAQQPHHHHRNHHPLDFRYRFSPYRKAGSNEPPHFHDDYVLVAKYPQDEEPGFDFVKFLRTALASFARPLAKLVPSFAKDNRDDPQCYDLLVCEAQRVSAFMGPTAEALAATFGTLLTWAATEDVRPIMLDAINSGRENTCQQQIRDCEGRSGGKSALTVIAQVMEMRLR